MAQVSGNRTKIYVWDETTWGEVPTTPTAYRIPITENGFDGGKRINRVDFNVLDGAEVPSAPFNGKISVPVTLRVPLQLDPIGWMIKHAVGGYGAPTNNGDGTYTHQFDLGGTMPVGLGIERQHPDKTAAPYRVYKGMKVLQMSHTLDVEGGAVFEFSMDGKDADAWAASSVIGTTTDYTDSPLGYCAATLKIDGSAVAYISSLNFTLDRQVNTDNYPVGNACLRSDLARGKPTLRGSMTAFLLDNDTLIAKAEGDTPIALTIDYKDITSEPGMQISMGTVLLTLTSEPVDTSMGLSVNFDIAAYGSNALTVRIRNSVATY